MRPVDSRIESVVVVSGEVKRKQFGIHEICSNSETVGQHLVTVVGESADRVSFSHGTRRPLLADTSSKRIQVAGAHYQREPVMVEILLGRPRAPGALEK
jgi:hypothetical protein